VSRPLPQIPQRWLPLAAGLLLFVAALLAIRVGLQLQDLSATHKQTALQEGLVRDYAARIGTATTGEALIAAPASQASRWATSCAWRSVRRRQPFIPPRTCSIR